jgi:beta-glucuronidase
MANHAELRRHSAAAVASAGVQPDAASLCWLVAALLVCAPLMTHAQGYTPRPQERAAAAPESASAASAPTDVAAAPSASLTNLPGRQRRSLNGRWQALIDPYGDGIGQWKAVWKDRTASGKTEFIEYGFDDANTLQVPGDFNTQRPELTYLEGSVWYRKAFEYDAAAARRAGRRLFVHFGGANHRTDVFLNGNKLGSHEGGFTPFQFELTDAVQQGENRLLVHVDNRRRKDGIPGQGYDWFNYGGLTRDVDLVETPSTYIQDYFIQAAASADASAHGQPGAGFARAADEKDCSRARETRLQPRQKPLQRVQGWVKLAGSAPAQPVRVRIPELDVDVHAQADASGLARIAFEAPFEPWSPQDPKLYRVRVSTPQDALDEEIGLRTLAVHCDEILLNGKPVFLRGVALHEEIDGRRAHSEEDARRLLQHVLDLGANFARLAHYPHNEHIVRLADRLGVLLWLEIPVYQHIDFADPDVRAKAQVMLAEMIGRDRNRAAAAFWGVGNETYPGAERDAAQAALVQRARELDPTRPVVAAFFAPGIDAQHRVTVRDPLATLVDVVGINEYFGWYVPWPVEPERVTWTPLGKPLIVSEFGAEARYGHHGADDVASAWNEEFQAAFYRKQLRMLGGIPFLRGTAPWVLMDFRSPVRMHPFQAGYNRKGLLSERGEKKQAWQVMRDFYLEQAR